MQVQITDLGVAALTAGGGAPVTLTSCIFGSGVGYIPLPTDTALHGSSLFTVVPSSPTAVNGNVVQYSAYLDYSAGDFNFGEFGLFMQNGDLFALGANDVLISKLKQTSALTGNSIRLDVYLSMVGDNYEMWLDLANSNSGFRMATVNSIDQLLPSKDAIPNAYIVQAAETTQTSFLAYTDRQGLWNFDAYAFSTTANQSFTVVSATNTTVSIAIADYNATMVPQYLGDRIIQFTSGALYSICRNLVSIATTPSAATFTFQTPFAIVPTAGDTFYLYKRDPLSTTNVEVPPATTTDLGVVKIGEGLSVLLSPDPDAGEISVDRDTIPGGVVFSVNSQQGEVELTVEDIPGSILTVNGQGPDGTGNVTVTFPPPTLPIATQTTTGVVKASATVTVASDGTMGLGFTPVTSVNGGAGDVVITGLINPIPLTTGQDLNTMQVTGLFYATTDVLAQSVVNGPGTSGTRTSCVLEIKPVSPGVTAGDVFQVWTQHGTVYERRLTGTTWSGWTDSNTINVPLATTASAGAVVVSTGLAVTPTGYLSTNIHSVNGHNGINGPLGPETADIVLTAADVGALDASIVGVQGGVAGYLDEDPSATPADQNVSDYIYGRLSQEQLPLGALYYLADWNASTNAATWTDPETSYVHTFTLQNTGLMSDSWSDGTTSFSIQVPANGKIFRVTTAGTTSVDGYNVWNVGDLAVASGALWRRWPVSIAPIVSPVIDVATFNPATVTNGNAYNITGATQTITLTTAHGAIFQECTIVNYTAGTVLTFTGAVVGTASGGLHMSPNTIASLKWIPSRNQFILFGDTAP